MIPDSLRFVWGNPPVAGARWRLGLFNFTRPPRAHRDSRRSTAHGAEAEDDAEAVLRVSLRGALAWGASFTLAAYLAGAGIIALQLDARSPHNRIGYLDLVLPTRWAGLDRLRGEALLAEAKEELDAGRFAPGLALLRAGLSRAPQDHTSRLQLASAYASGNLRTTGIDILVEGLEHGYPGKRYAESLLQLLTLSGLDQEAADTALRLHALWLKQNPSAPRDAAEESWLQEIVAKNLIRAGRGAEAIAFAEAQNPAQNPFRREVVVAVHVELGDHEAARAEAQAWLLDNPQSIEATRLLVAIHRKLGDYEAMERHLDGLRRLLPPGPETHLIAITNNHQAGRSQARDEALEDMLFRYGASSRTYEAAAPIFSELSFAEGLDRLDAEVARQGLPARPIHWARLTLALNQSQWKRVALAIDALESSRGAALTEAEKAWLLTLRRLSAACLDESTGTDVALVASVSSRSFSLKVYKRVITALLEVGKVDAAATVLTLAEGPYPRSPDIQTLRTKIEGLAALKLQTAQAARPAAPRVPVGSFAEFSAEFSLRLEEQGPAQALELIDVARRANPDWFTSESLRVDRMELPLRSRGDDPLRLQLIARSVLARAPDEAAGVLKLADDIRAQHPDHARLLLLEMIRQKTLPDDALAKLRQWYPNEFAPAEAAPDAT